MPARVKIEWVSASADMPYYRRPAEVVTLAETAPVGLFNPMQPLALQAASWAARPAAGAAFLQQIYDRLQVRAGDKYHLAPMSDPYFALPLYSAKPLSDPENKERDKKLKTNAALAAAGLVAAVGLPEAQASAVAGWQAEAVVRSALLKEPDHLKPI